MEFGVIRSISLDVLGAETWSTAFSFYVGYLVDQREQLSNVMTVRLSQDDRQWNAIAVSEQMVLASRFAPIRGIWARFCASTRSTKRRAIYQGTIPIDPMGRLQFGQQGFKDALPDARAVPASEVTQASVTGRKVRGGGEPAPGNPRAEHEKNACENAPGLARLSSGELHMAVLPWFGKERLDTLPQFVGQNGAGHDEDPRGLRHSPADGVPKTSEIG